jgi:hypothetical protein
MFFYGGWGSIVGSNFRMFERSLTLHFLSKSKMICVVFTSSPIQTISNNQKLIIDFPLKGC